MALTNHAEIVLTALQALLIADTDADTSLSTDFTSTNTFIGEIPEQSQGADPFALCILLNLMKEVYNYDLDQCYDYTCHINVEILADAGNERLRAQNLALLARRIIAVIDRNRVYPTGAGATWKEINLPAKGDPQLGVNYDLVELRGTKYRRAWIEFVAHRRIQKQID
jgi:hypothetical protein